MRKAKEDAVAARNKAAAGLKRKENARVQRAADEFRKLRTSVQHLEAMHKGWAGATSRTATRLRGDAKFAAASGDNVSGLASSVGNMKQVCVGCGDGGAVAGAGAGAGAGAVHAGVPPPSFL